MHTRLFAGASRRERRELGQGGVLPTSREHESSELNETMGLPPESSSIRFWGRNRATTLMLFADIMTVLFVPLCCCDHGPHRSVSGLEVRGGGHRQRSKCSGPTRGTMWPPKERQFCEERSNQANGSMLRKASTSVFAVQKSTALAVRSRHKAMFRPCW